MIYIKYGLDISQDMDVFTLERANISMFLFIAATLYINSHRIESLTCVIEHKSLVFMAK